LKLKGEDWRGWLKMADKILTYMTIDPACNMQKWYESECDMSVNGSSEAKVAQMKNDGVALQSQAGGFGGSETMTVTEVKERLAKRDMKLGAGYVGNVFRDPMIDSHVNMQAAKLAIEVFSLRAKNERQELDIKQLCMDMATLAGCNAKLQAEIKQLKAEKQAEDVADINRMNESNERFRIIRKGGYKVANAISNYDNASSKMGLPLHDRY
jgi:hypothetical protein